MYLFNRIMVSAVLINSIFIGKPLAQLKSPDEVYGDLFIAVQTSDIFTDYKTFPDCVPLQEPKKIMESYAASHLKAGFNLKKFVYKNFRLPDSLDLSYKTDTTVSISKHINSLWEVLTRTASVSAVNSSLVALPHAYVVPGGRFRELFYWDGYFIMLGLDASGKKELLKSMMDDYSFLIDTYGFIPNGNRTYFMSRSQPPFYALMVELMAENNPDILPTYIHLLEKEYEFWMNGSNNIKTNYAASKRVVRMMDGELLNRYWDDCDVPRPEAYGKDVAQSKGLTVAEAKILYRNIRAACESGWDFSTRWNKDGITMNTIHTTDIVPVDLNCLLYFLEQTLNKAYQMKGMKKNADKYALLASKRKTAILKYCWSETAGFFMDYDFTTQKNTASYSMAAVFPLYFKIATQEQANSVAQKLENDFLKDGGYLTTLVPSSYQWDSPNGWAPLQWMAAKGLLNYDKNELAAKGAKKWLLMNEKVFKKTGKLIEKYNVIEKNETAGGGEYELQDGFGWTNGVYLKLKNLYGE